MGFLGEVVRLVRRIFHLDPRQLWRPFGVWLIVALGAVGYTQSLHNELAKTESEYITLVQLGERQQLLSHQILLLLSPMFLQDSEYLPIEQISVVLDEFNSALMVFNNSALLERLRPSETSIGADAMPRSVSIVGAEFSSAVGSVLQNRVPSSDLSESANDLQISLEQTTLLLSLESAAATAAIERLFRIGLGLRLVFIAILSFGILYPVQKSVRRTIDGNINELKNMEQRQHLKSTIEEIFEFYSERDFSRKELENLVTERLAKALNTGRVSIWYFSAERDAIVCGSLYELENETHSSDLVLREEDYGSYFDALNTNMTISADNARTDTRTNCFLRSYLEPLDIYSMLDVPIRTPGGLQGVICCEAVGNYRNWSEAETQLVTYASLIVANALTTSELMRVAEDLEQAFVSANAANIAKTEFLANMSHEIRTPMNGVLGMASMALSSDLPDDAREYINMIQESGDSLLVILSDILDISKLESGDLVIEEIQVDLKKTVNSVSALLAPQIESCGISYESNISNDVQWPQIVSDPTRVRQVLLNLLGNAKKFTKDGSIKLNISQTKLDSGLIETKFDVIDTGIGVSEDKQEDIFRAFSQADQSTTRDYGGTGLGLSICKRLVELMDGEIGVRSDLGVGSMFWFTIVCAEFAESGEIQSRSA